MIDCAAHLYRAPSLSSCGQISLRCPSTLCQHPEVGQAPCHFPVAYRFTLDEIIRFYSLKSGNEGHYMLCTPAEKLISIAPDSFYMEVRGDNLSRAMVLQV